jgi:hypothetical protein
MSLDKRIVTREHNRAVLFVVKNRMLLMGKYRFDIACWMLSSVGGTREGGMLSMLEYPKPYSSENT